MSAVNRAQRRPSRSSHRTTGTARSVAAVVIAVLLAACASPAASAAAAQATAAATPIHHLVVMMQQGHSFDNYFGTLPGADHIPKGVCLPAGRASSRPAAGTSTPSPTSGCVAPYPLTADGSREQLTSSPAAEAIAVNGGHMDGFVKAQAVHGADGRVAMGYFPADGIPALTALAAGGVVFDHWFSPMPGGPVGNTLYAMAAQAPGNPQSVPAAGWGDVPLIFDSLQKAGVSWRIYVQNYSPTLDVTTATARERASGQVARVPALAIPAYLKDSSLRKNVVDLSQYYHDVSAGTLPAVSFLITTRTTEAPPATPTRGQAVVRDAADALIASSSWPSSAFLLEYADSGGWYDHVPPPVVNGVRAGVRVPAILISPYSPPGSVDSTVFTSSSVLRFIESNWKVAPLTSQDRHAADLASAFDFTQPPRASALLAMDPVRSGAAQPSGVVLYFGYAAVIVLALVAAGWTVWAAYRRRSGSRRRSEP
jgi:phospholipase C